MQPWHLRPWHLYVLAFVGLMIAIYQVGVGLLLGQSNFSIGPWIFASVVASWAAQVLGRQDRRIQTLEDTLNQLKNQQSIAQRD